MSTLDYRSVRRMLVAYSRTVDDGPELADLLRLRADLSAAIAEAVHRLRSDGITWATIGDAAGITAASAHSRWMGRKTSKTSFPESSVSRSGKLHPRGNS